MPSNAHEQLTISLTDDKDVAEVICTVLGGLSYQIQRASPKFRQVIATESLSEQHGRLRWRYEFKATISWSPGKTDSNVTVTVSESEYSNSHLECTNRCSAIVKELAEAAVKAKTLNEENRDTRYGSADFGTMDDLATAGYVTQRIAPDQLLLSKQQGKFLAVPQRLTPYHAIICGATGTGKSSGFFIPNLIERLGSSMIVTEATSGTEVPELFSRTAGWRKQAGHKIYWFNPTDMTSTRINPVDLVRYAPADRTVDQAEALADLIIRNTIPPGSRSDPVWDKSEKFLLLSLILNAAAADKQFGHLGAIRWLLLKGTPVIQRVMNDSPSELAADQYDGFLENTSENFRHGVVSGLLSRLNPWLTPQVVTLTSTTDFSIEELKDQLFTFYLSVPARRTDMKTIAALTFNFLLDTALNLKFKRPLALLLDEFTNFGYVQGMSDALSIIRKTGISAVLGFQDYTQLQKVYGTTEADIILSQPGTSIFFRPRKIQQARLLSDALGTRTFHEKQILDNGHVVDRFMPRPLMTPDELMALDENLVLIFTPTTKPVKVAKLHWSEYELATGYPPPTAPPHSIEELVRRGGRTGPRKKRSYKQPTPSTNAPSESEKADDRQSNHHQSESRTNQGSSPLDRDTPDLDLFGR